MTIQPTIERPHPADPGGIQKIYRFDNGYGLSVVRFQVAPGVGSYGFAEGLWELAVLRFHGEDTTNGFELTYDTPITNDVIGHLTDAEVEAIAERVRDLSNPDVVHVTATVGETPALTSGEESAR